MHYDEKISGARIRTHDMDPKASALPTTPQRLTTHATFSICAGAAYSDTSIVAYNIY